MQNLETIDNIYSILEIKNEEPSFTTYSVIHNQTQVNYLIDVFNDHIPANMINILNNLNALNNPYIIHYVANGNGPIVLNNKPPVNREYIVYENIIHSDLYLYLTINHNQRFTERQAKFIFKKILEGIRAMHNANICHRDLMAKNILLDGNYNPNISGFYLSCINANTLQDIHGITSYTAPELLLNQPYNGIQSDIFSLGQLLFVLVTGRLGFNNANQNDNFYRLIMNPQNHAQYWEFLNDLNLSQSFKNLFVSMVAPNPGQRPTIDQILNDEWMQEINNLNDNQRIALENQVLQEFQNREVLLQQHPAMIINNHDDLNNDR